MKKILDLRFVIGVFFTTIGILLFVHYLGSSPGQWNLNKEAGWGSYKSSSINQWCGIIFGLFGIIMILLSFVKDANDELLKDE
jgi:hypothetical protein